MLKKICQLKGKCLGMKRKRVLSLDFAHIHSHIKSTNFIASNKIFCVGASSKDGKSEWKLVRGNN